MDLAQRILQLEQQVDRLQTILGEVIAKNLPLELAPHDLQGPDPDQRMQEVFQFDDRLDHPSFYPAETDPKSGMVFRWLGPHPEAMFVSRVPRTRPVLVEIDVPTTADPSMADEVQILCDGNVPRDFSAIQVATGGYQIRAEFPGLLNSNKLPFSLISLKLPRVVSFSCNNNDPRSGCIGVHRVRISQQ